MKQAIAYILVLIAATVGMAAQTETTGSHVFSNPVIKKYGGIVAIPDAAPQADGGVRIYSVSLESACRKVRIC